MDFLVLDGKLFIREHVGNLPCKTVCGDDDCGFSVTIRPATSSEYEEWSNEQDITSD